MRKIEYTTACQDWGERLKTGKSIIPEPIFKDSAETALRIFKALRIVDIAGQPTFGEASEQWVFDFVKAIFGGYNRATGQQLIKNYLLMISKKNSKSTLSAGIMLTALLQCWRNSEEHLIIAPTKEIAANSFEPAAGMVRADPQLQRILKVRDHIKTIEHKQTRSTLKIISADTRTTTGKKAGRVLIDELHEFGKMSKSGTILREATGGQISRPEGFTIYLTTQGDEAPAGVFKEKLNYFRRVRDGQIIDKQCLPVIYEYPEDMIEDKSYLDPKNFYITNPNIGKSVSQDWLIKELERAKNSHDDSVLQSFLAKHLNIEVGLNLQSDRWAGADFWEESEINLSLDDLIEQSEVITAGIDGGGLDDLLGLYVMGRRPDGVKIGWAYAWVHSKTLAKRPDIASRLEDFAEANELAIVRDKKNSDITQLAKICSKLAKSGLLYKIGVDPMGLGQIEEALAAEYIHSDDYIVTVPQGWRLTSAIKTCERWLANAQFKPAKQDCMRWCVGNAKIIQKGNNILITKQASGSAKIDPVIAMLNATAIMAVNPDAQAGLGEFLKEYQ